MSSDIQRIYTGLPQEEQRVLLRLAERIEKGREKYGNMKENLESYDFLDEMEEEALDFAVYREMQRLKEEM